MAQEGEGGGGEDALCQVYLKACSVKDIKNLTKVQHVFCMIPAGVKNAVEVLEHERKVAEKLIHETLESLGGIFKPERHKNVFKQSEWRANCRCIARRACPCCHLDLL